MPIITFIIFIIFATYWSFSSMLLASFGKYQVIQTQHSFFQSSNFNKYLPYLWIYQIFGLIWISEFIFACQALVVSGCVSIWYFTRDKNQLGFPIIRSIKRLVVFHLGTAAFGGLIIALVKFPRYILMYLEKKSQATSNSIVSYAAKCCICCLWCLEKFLKYINYNAYTIVNIEGKSFCTSSKKAFVLIVENSLRVAAINSVGDFMLFLAKMTVTALTLLVAVFLLKVPHDDVSSCLKCFLIDLFSCRSYLKAKSIKISFITINYSSYCIISNSSLFFYCF
jgi:solute carrier family 44 (choline transporter-like protein), member 1